MDVREFLGLTRSGDDLRWTFDVGTHLITPGQFLFGGCGLGAALVALEEATGRPTVWATAQYVSYAKTHSTVDITVEIQAVGGHLTQARAVAREGDREVLGVTAALGSNTLEVGGVWVEMPDVPAPDRCPPRRAQLGPLGPGPRAPRALRRHPRHLR